MIALTAGLVHAVEVPFTSFANVAKDVTIQPKPAEDRFGATDYLVFPAMPKKSWHDSGAETQSAHRS